MSHRNKGRSYKNEWDDIGWEYLKEHDPDLKLKKLRMRIVEYPYLSVQQMESRKRHEWLVGSSGMDF